MPAKRIGEMVVFGSEAAKDCMDMFMSSQSGNSVEYVGSLTVPGKAAVECGVRFQDDDKIFPLQIGSLTNPLCSMSEIAECGTQSQKNSPICVNARPPIQPVFANVACTGGLSFSTPSLNSRMCTVQYFSFKDKSWFRASGLRILWGGQRRQAIDSNRDRISNKTYCP